jgi:hypothetical protein
MTSNHPARATRDRLGTLRDGEGNREPTLAAALECARRGAVRFADDGGGGTLGPE